MKAVLAILPVISLIFASGCQIAGQSAESRFAHEQPAENYVNSPAYLNVQLGILYMQEGELGTALEKLQKALRQNPDLAVAHNTIAVLYEKMGENSLAKRHYEQSIQLDSNDSKLRNNYGQYLCRHGSELKAIKQFDIAAANPLYRTTHLPLANAGLCALRINEDIMAESYLRQALEKSPKLLPALVGMIRVSLRQAKYLQGRSYMQRYVALAKHTAETLWAGYQIEKNMRDKQAAASYAVRLKSRFPDSEQTMLLLEDIAPR